MKSMNDLLKSRGTQISQTSWPENSLPSAAIRQYGDLENFLKIFNPSIQRVCRKNEVQSSIGKCPTLITMDQAWGEGSSEAWLIPQLYDLSEFTGTKDKMTPRQIEQIAEIIRLKYGWLKATELMCFFLDYKAGNYGEFYGVVDPLKITTAISKYIQHRSQVIDSYEREKETKKAEEYRKKIQEGKTMSYSQWVEYKNKHKK